MTLEAKIEQAFEKFKRQKQERDSQDSHVQNLKRMTQEERSRRAIDKMTVDIKEHAEKMGRGISAEQARSEAVNIARTADKKAGRE